MVLQEHDSVMRQPASSIRVPSQIDCRNHLPSIAPSPSATAAAAAAAPSRDRLLRGRQERRPKMSLFLAWILFQLSPRFGWPPAHPGLVDRAANVVSEDGAKEPEEELNGKNEGTTPPASHLSKDDVNRSLCGSTVNGHDPENPQDAFDPPLLNGNGHADENSQALPSQAKGEAEDKAKQLAKRAKMELQNALMLGMGSSALIFANKKVPHWTILLVSVILLLVCLLLSLVVYPLAATHRSSLVVVQRTEILNGISFAAVVLSAVTWGVGIFVCDVLLADACA